MSERNRTICWVPMWNKTRVGVGLEHLLPAERVADSLVLALDEDHGPFRLTYRLVWDDSWRLHDAELVVVHVATILVMSRLSGESQKPGQTLDSGSSPG